MDLSTREKEILALIVKEYSSHDIAKNLEISIRTVDTHRKNIAKKLNTKSLIGFTKHAIREGMVANFKYNGRKRST